MVNQPVYQHEHRSAPRICLSWLARVRIAGQEQEYACTTVNIGTDGVCLAGAVPEISRPGGMSSPECVLDLTGPEGRTIEGLEMAYVWGETGGTPDSQRSGWRFTRVSVAKRRALAEELGGGAGWERRQGYEGWDEDEIDLWDYVKVLIRRRWLVAACTLVASYLQ